MILRKKNKSKYTKEKFKESNVKTKKKHKKRNKIL
jgi:hypothetical protein